MNSDSNCLDNPPPPPPPEIKQTEHDAVKLEDSEVEEDAPKSFLSFKFQAYEDFSKTLEGNNGNSVSSEITSTNKYEFMESAEDSSFTEKELNTNPNDGSSESEAVHGEFPENSQKLNHVSENEQPQFSKKKAHFLSPEDFSASDSNSEASIDSHSNGFLSDKDFEDLGNFIEIDGQRLELGELMKGVLGTEEDNNNGLHQELKNLEEDLHGEKVNPQEDNPYETEDSNSLETQWEHQELIEQLKMELRKVRATGLPTILEESESPKVMEDLKPWKIEENKFQHEERMDELHKIYKLYSERMRKFDILNYQKMYAIGQSVLLCFCFFMVTSCFEKAFCFSKILPLKTIQGTRAQ